MNNSYFRGNQAADLFLYINVKNYIQKRKNVL